MAKRRSKKETPDKAIPDSAATPVEAPARPEAEEIALLAHRYWLARGCPAGSPEEDWFRAEEELKTRRAAPRKCATRDVDSRAATALR